MRSILVIDDDAGARELIIHQLKPTGYNLIEAENGIEGIRKALNHHPFLITVDVMMPFLNGLHMMRIFDLLKLQIPAIFVTVKEDIHKYEKSFPNIKNVCLNDNINLELFPRVDAILKQRRREYNDVEYTLQEQEIFGLLAKSDRKRLLIATDSEVKSDILKSIKQTDAFEIYHAPNGQEAVFKAVMIKPDLIICDTDLPEIDGIMLARILYILGHPFPLIYLSDRRDTNMIKKVSKLEGIKGYLLKSEITKDLSLLPARIDETLDLSEEDKKQLQASYSAINIEKIGDLSEESSIWASLSP